MLHLVKIEPNLFLIARTSVKPGMLEVPLQVPVGHFSFENQQAAGNGTGERRQTCIGEGGGQIFEGIEGGTGCLWDDNSFYRRRRRKFQWAQNLRLCLHGGGQT